MDSRRNRSGGGAVLDTKGLYPGAVPAGAGCEPRRRALACIRHGIGCLLDNKTRVRQAGALLCGLLPPHRVDTCCLPFPKSGRGSARPSSDHIALAVVIQGAEEVYALRYNVRDQR